MVNAWMTVGRWGTFKKDELRTAFALLNTLVEHIFCVPLFQNLLIHISEVQFCSFCKFHLVIYNLTNYHLQFIFLFGYCTILYG